VDYAGDTVPVIVDTRTGETRAAHIFVAVMGGSSLTFAFALAWCDAAAVARSEGHSENVVNIAIGRGPSNFERCQAGAVMPIPSALA
jgi:hypothetical protein